MIRVVIKGKQGEGKTRLASRIVTMLHQYGESVSVQDGGHTEVYQLENVSTRKKIPVTVAIIVKQG